MLYLLLAIASSALLSVCMRLSEKYVRSKMVMFTANYAVCMVISLFYTGGAHLFAFAGGMGWAAMVGAVSGFLYLLSLALFEKNIRLNGVILSSAAMKLGGVLIPVVTAVAFFHEGLGWTRLAGVAIAVAAVVLINVEKVDAGRDGKRAWLLILLFGSGLSDVMANVYDKTGEPVFKNQYLFYSFLAAALLSLIISLARREKAALPDILSGVVIGVPNYFSARFLLAALGDVPAVITYPAFSVGTIIVITTVSMLAFREKLTRRKKGALALILAALVLLNI